jgi:hypothetical protein
LAGLELGLLVSAAGLTGPEGARDVTAAGLATPEVGALTFVSGAAGVAGVRDVTAAGFEAGFGACFETFVGILEFGFFTFAAGCFLGGVAARGSTCAGDGTGGLTGATVSMASQAGTSEDGVAGRAGDGAIPASARGVPRSIASRAAHARLRLDRDGVTIAQIAFNSGLS